MDSFTKNARRAGNGSFCVDGEMEYTKEQKETGEWIRAISAESHRGWHAFYHTTAWRKKRRAILKRDHYACQRCRRQGRYTPATTVHHKRHLKDAPELALTDGNLESLCAACHEEEHPEYRYKPKGFRNPERW